MQRKTKTGWELLMENDVAFEYECFDIEFHDKARRQILQFFCDIIF